MGTLGDDIMTKLEEAARFSEEGPGVTRKFCTEEHAEVAKLFRRWMADAGLEAEMDAAANVVGRLPGPSPDARTLIMGSHQDTVVSGGKYDGMLGAVLPIVCLQALKETGVSLPYAVEVVAFGDEEGTRFQSTLVGSHALAGTLTSGMLEARDSHGITMAQAIKDFGGDPDAVSKLARDPDKVLGFLEVHIEQGPILEAEDLPVGVVTAITGIERHGAVFTGKAGHAGTVPMEQRSDALVAAAEAIAIVDRHCRETEGLVGVVGKIENRPNAVNVIPSECAITIELRSPEAPVRQAARKSVTEEIRRAAKARGVSVEIDQTYEANGIACAPWMIEALEEAVKERGIAPRRLFSGAGHDGLAMNGLTDVGMLFVRCKDGLSHHPDEAITADDAETAARVVMRFLQDLGKTV